MTAPSTVDRIRSRVEEGAHDSPALGVLPIKPKVDEAAERALRFSDTGNATRFALQHGEDVRYCYAWKSWIVFDGRRWEQDVTGEVMRRAKLTVKRMYDAAASATESERAAFGKHAIKSDSASRIEAMLSLAQSEPGIAVKPDDFDTDPWILTVLNGTLDLRTGKLRPHRREDLCTKMVHVAYDPSATCPQFLAFLARVQEPEVIAFLRRASGYTLTGSTREQCLFFLYGQGGNGKTTFVEVLRLLMGDFSTNAQFDTFLERKSERGPRDLARFFGSRFVTAIEADEGKRFDEAALKTITGSDTITACRIFEHSFEFKPAFKLWLASNHKPVIRGTDQGIWRRMRLVPFSTKIPDCEQDGDLDAKLAEEVAGILAWAVEGCLEWQRGGLGTPTRVTSATADYRSDMDTTGDFLTDRCEMGDRFSVGASMLYGAYKDWAITAGEHPISGKALSAKLSDRGIQKVKHGTVTYFGLRLILDDSGRSGGEVENLLTRDDSREVLDLTPTSSKIVQNSPAAAAQPVARPGLATDACIPPPRRTP
jgi:putative DNA primase/helicase